MHTVHQGIESSVLRVLSISAGKLVDSIIADTDHLTDDQFQRHYLAVEDMLYSLECGGCDTTAARQRLETAVEWFHADRQVSVQVRSY